jgi:hypothetical protein
MKLMIHEILEKAAEASSKEEKIKILQENNSLALRDILRGGMDDTIEFILPEGKPPHEDPEKVGYSRSALYNQTKRFKYFVKGGPGESLPAPKRERMFINILESIHPKEGELVLLMKDKRLIKSNNSAHYSGITKKLVQEAFPGLIRE